MFIVIANVILCSDVRLGVGVIFFVFIWRACTVGYFCKMFECLRMCRAMLKLCVLDRDDVFFRF